MHIHEGKGLAIICLNKRPNFLKPGPCGQNRALTHVRCCSKFNSDCQSELLPVVLCGLTKQYLSYFMGFWYLSGRLK